MGPVEPLGLQVGVAQGGEPGLDLFVDDPQPLLEWPERALHGVQCQPLDVAQVVAESLRQLDELVGQRDIAHQPVVGVDRDPEPQPAQQPDRVLWDRRCGPGVDIGGRAHLERDPTVAHIGRKPAQRCVAVLVDGDVVDDPDPVTQSFRTAVVQRLGDRRQAERLAGVDRDVGVLPHDELKCIEVPARGITGLGPGDVEADHAVVPVADRELCDLVGAGRGPHGGEQGSDGDRFALRTDAEPFDHSVHHLVERQSGFGVLLGCEPDLGIDDAVCGHVLGRFGGGPHQGFFRLGHPDGVGEGLQVQLEVPAVGSSGEPLRQLVDILGRKAGVALLLGQLDHGGRAHTAVEVIVEQHLGRGSDLIGEYRADRATVRRVRSHN